MPQFDFLPERSRALVALGLAGSAWGLTLPLSAIALRAIDPAWLVSIRFGLAALLLGLIAGRDKMRAALRPRIVGWGVLGYGGVVLMQTLALQSTSVSHASVLAGVAPALIVLVAIARGGRRPSWQAALGLLGAVGGVALLAGGGGRASLDGDGLVLLASVCFSIYIVAQRPLLVGQSPVAVTAIQMGAGSAATLPLALISGAMPQTQEPATLALLGLVVVGSLLPFTLYAWSQTRVSSEVAAAFLNLEALVGGVVGVLAFHDPTGVGQLFGMVLVLGGILLVAAKAPRLRTSA